MGLAASRQEAFWESCGFGHIDRARYFLEEGDIDVNWVSYVIKGYYLHSTMGLAASRQEAFWESCGFGHIDRARYFLEEGDIDVNWVSYVNDCCPIHTASQGKPEIVDLLLEYKCDVNVTDSRGNLALHHAAMKGHADIVQKLIDAGSQIDVQEKNGWTALHNAAYWCHPNVVKILIKNGCNVHIQNKDERTALHECARSQQTEDGQLGHIALMLVEAGSDVNAKSSDLGEADLTGLMYAAYHNHHEVASVLIDAGCELDAIGTTFWTALHWASDRGHEEVVYILLEANADPTKKGMRGENALDRAKTDNIREVLTTAVNLHRELNKVNMAQQRLEVRAYKPPEPYVPKCDAKFKSQSFLPSNWKPTSSVSVKNLINEKKSRLAAMTTQTYRNELARTTGASNVITDTEQGHSDTLEINLHEDTNSDKLDEKLQDNTNRQLDTIETQDTIADKSYKDSDKKSIEKKQHELESHDDVLSHNEDTIVDSTVANYNTVIENKIGKTQDTNQVESALDCRTGGKLDNVDGIEEETNTNAGECDKLNLREEKNTAIKNENENLKDKNVLDTDVDVKMEEMSVTDTT